ncbi:MAG: ArsR/SmtB family transcription factor [Bryobacteraceae bacterium]
MEIGSDIASIAGLIGDPVRATILAALVDGRALPAGELAFLGNVAPQTASFHLGKLVDAALISVERQGKYSYYRLANDAVASALESLAALSPLRSEVESQFESRRESERVGALRFARSCYKHLAGRLAVEINQALLKRELILANADKSYFLTGKGRKWCQDLGVRLPRSASKGDNVGRACLDWTERRHHLGGELGVAFFSRSKELGWLVANPKTRAIRVTHAGVRELHQQLGISIPL